MDVPDEFPFGERIFLMLSEDSRQKVVQAWKTKEAAKEKAYHKAELAHMKKTGKPSKPYVKHPVYYKVLFKELDKAWSGFVTVLAGLPENGRFPRSKGKG